MMRVPFWVALFFVAVFVFLQVLIVKGAHAEDYSYFELSQGYNVSTLIFGRTDWQGSCPTELALGHHFNINRHVYTRASFSHLSNVCVGPPFNTKAETTLDQVRITIGARW